MSSHELTRRDFLRTTAAGAAIGGLGSGIAHGVERGFAATKKPLLPSGVLGRTKYPATLVSFGAILLGDKLGTRVLKAGIDAGINLLHTSASYGKGKSVLSIGDLFKSSPEYRDKVFLALKSFTPDKEQELTDMLERLNTDRADLLLSTMDSPDPRRLEVICKAQEQLKAKGLIRHTGFVCHGDMNGVVEMVLEKAPTFFDATLLSTALLAPPDVKEGAAAEKSRRFVENLSGLRKQKVGIISMKSGSRNAVKQGASAFQPHVKHLLAAGVDTVLTSIDTFDQVGMIKSLELKSPTTTPAERAADDAFRNSRGHACMMCGDCAKACPRGVPVNDLMRVRMYHDEYGWAAHARDEFELLGPHIGALASGCGDCTACSEVCPVHLASARNVQRVATLFA